MGLESDFRYFSIKSYGVGIYKNHLTEAILIDYHSI